MLHHWLLITFSWLGSVRLQYINTGGPGADIIFEPIESPFQYVQYYSQPMRNDYEHEDRLTEQLYPSTYFVDQQRKRRADPKDEVGQMDKRWASEIADDDKTVHHRSENSISTPFTDGYSRAGGNNSTRHRHTHFNPWVPWGGKRETAGNDIDYDPISPPFLVGDSRAGNTTPKPPPPFSPWGGKRETAGNDIDFDPISQPFSDGYSRAGGNNSTRHRHTHFNPWVPWGGKRETAGNDIDYDPISPPFLVGDSRAGNTTPKPPPPFSPWGGKRETAGMEHMWTWKRGSNVREPNMPKRVRFSPWGGKRSGQMIYKAADSKGAKIIYSTTFPELTRIMSNSQPNEGNYKFAGYQLIRSLDNRHPINILTLNTRTDDKTLRETMPFNNFLESLPNTFKPGHPYFDMNLKRDGKRKVKFSAWGGKRSAPIIGPIWTPAPQDVKDSTLDGIILIRNSQENNEPTI